ncbi:MAG TPA: hypothetical protein VM533_01055 [Fimbriiglobus sp.]|jgi:DNA topoisomerase-1|nr:hypothetical protein [Fimbriiglobus sp.]
MAKKKSTLAKAADTVLDAVTGAATSVGKAVGLTGTKTKKKPAAKKKAAAKKPAAKKATTKKTAAKK